MISQLTNIIISAYSCILECVFFLVIQPATPPKCTSRTHISLLSLEPGKELGKLKEILRLLYGGAFSVITQNNATTH